MLFSGGFKHDIRRIHEDSIDIENFDLLGKSEKNPDFSSIFSISDIREFFAKRKI